MPLVDNTLLSILSELCLLLEFYCNWHPLSNKKTPILPLVIQAHNEFQQNTEESKNLHHPESALEMKPYHWVERNIFHIKQKAVNVYAAAEALLRQPIFFCACERLIQRYKNWTLPGVAQWKEHWTAHQGI